MQLLNKLQKAITQYLENNKKMKAEDISNILRQIEKDQESQKDSITKPINVATRALKHLPLLNHLPGVYDDTGVQRAKNILVKIAQWRAEYLTKYESKRNDSGIYDEIRRKVWILLEEIKSESATLYPSLIIVLAKDLNIKINSAQKRQMIHPVTNMGVPPVTYPETDLQYYYRNLEKYFENSEQKLEVGLKTTPAPKVQTSKFKFFYKSKQHQPDNNTPFKMYGNHNL